MGGAERNGATAQEEKLQERPLQTREHRLAALSVNHVERLILRQGHIVARKTDDYGYDLVMETFDYGTDPDRKRGEFEGGSVLFQLKATQHLRLLDDGETISLSIEQRHLLLWKEEMMPVILVVYDAITEQAYWLYVQRYLLGVVLPLEYISITVHILKRNLLDEGAVETFRQYKTKVDRRANKEALHGE